MIYCDIYNFDYSIFYKQVLENVLFDNLFTFVDFSHDITHKAQYILLIIDEYIRMHATYLARISTIQLHSKIFGKTFEKLKQFAGQ